MINPITREHVQYALGAIAALAVVGVYIATHVFSIGMACFAGGLLGVANVSDFFNSPPGGK